MESKTKRWVGVARWLLPVMALVLPDQASAQTPATFTPLDRPAYGLYTLISRPLNFTAADYAGLGQNFRFLHGNLSPEQFDAIRKVNPAFKGLRYINSTYTRFDADVGVVESRYRMGLSMHLAAQTRDALAPDTTSFRVESLEAGKKGRKATIAIRASTVAGDLSSTNRDQPSTKHYVFWIRIGDELMRVNAFDEKSGVVKVTRGFSGTTPAAHATGAKVFSPIYLGFKRGNKDKYPGQHPGGPGDRLRYVLDPNSAAGWKYFSDQVVVAMTEGRTDGVWLDTLNVGDFNLSDCLGRKVEPWDFRSGRLYKPDDFREGQERKMDFIQRDVKERLGRYPMLVANNLKPSSFYPGSGGMRRLLESTEVKPRPLDGFCMEGGLSWQKADEEHEVNTWRSRIVMLMDAAQNGLAAMPIWGGAGGQSVGSEPDTPGRDRAERFAYASYLLAVEKEGRTLMGTYAIYQADGRRFVKVHPMYFYPIGDPAESVKPNEFDRYALNEGAVYRRRFTNGQVLVNASDMSQRVDFEESFIDPDTGRRVSGIDMAPGTGKILLSAKGAP